MVPNVKSLFFRLAAHVARAATLPHVSQRADTRRQLEAERRILRLVAKHLAKQRGRRLGRETMPETLTYSTVAAVHTLWLAARADGIGVG